MVVFEVLPLCDDILNLVLDFKIGDTAYWKSIFTNEVLKYVLFNIEVLKVNNIDEFNINVNEYKMIARKIAFKFNVNDMYKAIISIKNYIEDINKFHFKIRIIFKPTHDYDNIYNIFNNLGNLDNKEHIMTRSGCAPIYNNHIQFAIIYLIFNNL